MILWRKHCGGESWEQMRMERGMRKIRTEHHTFMGTVRFAGWLFTIGFLHLTFWKGVFALVVWPYYLGAHFSALAH